MGRNVTFTIDADTAQLLRKAAGVEQAQGGMEKGFDRLAASGANASAKLGTSVAGISRPFEMATAAATGFERQVVATSTVAIAANAKVAESLRSVVREYDLASTKMSSVRARGATSVGTSARTYSLAPLAAAPSGVSAMEATGAAAYGMKRTDQESFARFLKAEGIRGQRARGRYDADRLAFVRTNSLTQKMDREAAASRKAAEESMFLENHKAKAWRIRQEEDAEKKGSKERWSTLGTAGALAAAAAYHTVSESLKEARETTLGFHDAVRGLVSLSGNVDNIGATKAGVLRKSNAWGVDPNAAAALEFRLESAGSDTDKGTINAISTKALQWNRLSGVDPQVAGTALLKLQSIFPQSVTSAANKLEFAADKGDLDMQEMATYGPDLVASAKAYGYKDSEALAMFATASKKLGRKEPVYTGLRNFMARAWDSEKKTGKKRTGSLGGDLEQMGGFNPMQMKDVYGQESVAVAQVLRDSKDEVTGYVSQMTAMGDGVDLVAQKLNKVMSDTGMRFTELTKVMENLNKNMPLQSGYKFQQDDQDMTARKLGLKSILPQWASAVAEPAGWLDTVNRATHGVGFGLAGVAASVMPDVFKTRGYQVTRKALDEEGRTDLPVDDNGRAVLPGPDPQVVDANRLYSVAQQNQRDVYQRVNADGVVTAAESRELADAAKVLKDAAQTFKEASDAHMRAAAAKNRNAHN